MMISVTVSGGAREDTLRDVLGSVFGLAERSGSRRRLLIVSAASGGAAGLIAGLKHEDMLLINADDKAARGLLARNKAPVITYGLNARTCVTASSVVEEDYRTVQICVQRKLPTFTEVDFPEVFVEEQEFSVNVVNRELSVHNLLAAVAAALVCGVPSADMTGLVV